MNSNKLMLFDHTIGDLIWATINEPEAGVIGKQNIDYAINDPIMTIQYELMEKGYEVCNKKSKY